VELPEGDGKPIATEYCQDCHRLTNLTKAHKAADDWRDTLQLMTDRGARLPPEDVETLIKYLSTNFGPKTDAPAPDIQSSPALPAIPVAVTPAANAAPGAPVPPILTDLPEGDGKATTIKYCQNCHVLTDIAKERKSSDEWRDNLRLTVHLGANIPADQIDILIQYLSRNFGPKSAGPVAGAASAKSPAQSQ
jgi:mono/diheme cytochrome c family protein